MQTPCFDLTSHCYLSGSTFKTPVVNSTSDLQQLLKYVTSRKIHLANFLKVWNLTLSVSSNEKLLLGEMVHSVSKQYAYTSILFQIRALLRVAQE